MSSDLQREIFIYARKNLAKVNVYIRDPYVSKYVTEEKMTRISFAGTVGGILGLFMGLYLSRLVVLNRSLLYFVVYVLVYLSINQVVIFCHLSSLALLIWIMKNLTQTYLGSPVVCLNFCLLTLFLFICCWSFFSKQQKL